MRDDLLNTDDMRIGKPSLWNDGSGRVSFYIMYKHSLDKRFEFESQMQHWLASNTSKWSLMYDFDQGAPFWTAVIQEEDQTIFVLRFGKAIW